jgi:hypothetical protein
MLKQTTIPQSWEDILGYYYDMLQEGFHKKPLYDLVLHIIEQGYSNNLHAFISGSTLAISNNNPIEPHNEVIFIDYKPGIKSFHFKFYRPPRKDPQLTKLYLEDEGIKRLDLFLGFVGWIE